MFNPLQALILTPITYHNLALLALATYNTCIIYESLRGRKGKGNEGAANFGDQRGNAQEGKKKGRGRGVEEAQERRKQVVGEEGWGLRGNGISGLGGKRGKEGNEKAEKGKEEDTTRKRERNGLGNGVRRQVSKGKRRVEE